MARAAWAARAQLVAQLRPFASPDSLHFGRAPASLVPELCSHLRGLGASDVRLTFAAFSAWPPDAPELQIGATKPPPDGENVTDNGQTVASTRLVDALVQLLIGGSRLGTTTHLLESANSIAAFAPCDCQASAKFWTVYAERVARLSAGDELDAKQLQSIFSSVAAWTCRCGSAGGENAWRRSTGGARGHMIRSVGGRLADPAKLNTLSLPDVIQLARDAALLGEPQFRLAASIGHRVGDPKTIKKLKTQEIVDLIGSAGKLGGRLHMMTRALADALAPQVSHIPLGTLVSVCSHLGALEMFPQRLMDSLEGPLTQGMHMMSTEELMTVLQASGRLRWRLPNVLSPLLASLGSPTSLASLSGAELACTLYELYRLDTWDETLVETLIQRIEVETSHTPLSRKRCANVLLALAYFSLQQPELSKRLLHELLRAQELPPEATFQVKTFEMAMRVGHLDITYEELGKLASRWLLGIRTAKTPPEARVESAFANDVSGVGQSISWKHAAEVEVGPYLLDFGGVLENEEDVVHPYWDESNPDRSLVKYCVALEADGPSHFYRPHGRPWHWTSMSKLRHRLLTKAKIRVAHVPYYDWAQLNSLEEKQEYVVQLLLQSQRSRVANRNAANREAGTQAPREMPFGADEVSTATGERTFSA